MKITDDMIHAACNAYDDHNKEHSNVLLRGVATEHGMKAALEAAIQAAWISVNDRMPDEYQNVIIKDVENEYQVAYLRRGNWVVDVGHYDVTYWMPLLICEK